MNINKLPFSNQFERGHSLNWAGHWKSGKYYFNDDYVTDFIIYSDAILVCRKSHQSSELLKPKLIYVGGKPVDVESTYWEFIMSPSMDNVESIANAEFISKATEADANIDPNVIIGDPYIKTMFTSGVFLYIPVKDIITQYKVGVPVLTQTMYDNITEDAKPKTWIEIPDKTDITETNAGNYLNIMFSAIRKLQAEVTRLKNSFEYGLVSYTGKDTAMSAVVSEYSSTDSEEPLWSIDEDDLSEVADATFNLKSEEIPPLHPVENIEYESNGVVTISGPVTWTDKSSGFKECTSDTKILLYLICDNINIQCSLSDVDNESNTLQIDLSHFGIPTSNTNKYNVCLLVSRAIQVDPEDPTKYGDKYIWFSISSYLTNITLLEGYYDPDTGGIVERRVNLDTSYNISSVSFNEDTNLYKFSGYSKYQDFSHKVIPSKPNDSDYRYKVAHIAIRAIDTFEELEDVEDYLLENELIWESDKDILWIKTKSGLRKIGSHGGDDSDMDENDVIELLKSYGIVYETDSGLHLSDIADVSIINNDTGKKFKFTVDSEGQLVSKEIPKETLKSIVDRLGTNISKEDGIRGFISRLLCRTDGNNKDASDSTDDLKLRSDRLKIGAVYCPLKSDVKFGCSHGYVELENTSDKDIPLDNVFLHFMHPNSSNALIVDKIELDGYIPKGGTYLIRGKQYADPKLDADVFINVSTFDKEWFIDGEAIDFSIDDQHSCGFLLTYGDKNGTSDITAESEFIEKIDNGAEKALYKYKWFFIDAIVINKDPSTRSGAYWGYTGKVSDAIQAKSNTIIKNTFELDPAKQAYQAHTQYDSSRYRVEFKAQDVQYLNLDKEFIEFPKTEEKYPVSKFTPKSSKEHKNVSTDKTKLDYNKPNMVTCSFGINVYTTRTFNWISAGQFDEYVFIKDGSSWQKFESYKAGDGGKTQEVGTIVRKEFSSDAIDCIYKRITGNFPGDESNYTSHKCILVLNSGSAVSAKTEFTYIVGRADKNGNPDLEHCSEEYTFTLYPESYIPQIYQITDQQGFHWIEYQVWAAAAKKVNSKIAEDCEHNNIIPVLINTGDMTQNGTRINEWLDYYNAGKVLFNHLEQVNVVGNNDLCNTDVTALGTGDDPGKSNSFYFHVFYCYEVDENNLPLIPSDTGSKKYVPSLYYIDFKNYRFVMVNSEITYVNCDKWFDRHKTIGGVKYPINVYTGWTVYNSNFTINSNDYFDNGFTSIYTMLYDMFNINEKYIITVCHEMPFTVITKDGLDPSKPEVVTNYRSLSAGGKTLVGSHLNQINGYDTVGIHWFSRLMESFNIKLCIGGHKHTYACTFPLCEYYYYDNGSKNSKDDGFMTMERTLTNDRSVSWIHDDINLSKRPLVNTTWGGDYSFEGNNSGIAHFSPATLVDLSNTSKYHPVVYFMCQATGYKLTSNKELPSNYQHFSRVIPSTVELVGKDNPDPNQKFPMMSIIHFSETFNNNVLENVTYQIKLARIHSIFNSGYSFTQSNFNKGKENVLRLSYAQRDLTTEKINHRYISWTIDKDAITTGEEAETETTLIEV